LELQGLGTLARVGRTTLALTLALIGLALLSSTARAASTAGKAAADPNTPVLVSSQDTPPKGYRLTAAKVKRLALGDPRVRAELRRHPRALGYEYTKGPGQWQVSWFSAGKHQRELMQVYVDDASGRVTQVWTGFQVAWTMARGYAGAFGRRVNAWYIWLPLCLLFVAPFLPWPLRRRRLTLLHLDLLVLLSFSVSLAFFNHAQIGLSVPLTYPPLIYLLVRMLLLAAGKGIPRAPLKLLIPVPWLLVAAVFLVGFRVGLNLTNSNVIDVGYSGVIGANRLVHDQPLYGGWPKDNPQGDTYAPVAYYAYVPFRAVFGWSGTWDDLPAAHAAAVFFDILTLLGLFLLGRRVRGPTLGAVLAYAWAAFPFSLWTLSSNTNDTLVALLIVLSLLVISSAPARGVAGALAGLTKFAPFVLAPLLLRGVGERPRKRSVLAYVLAYGLVVLAAMLPVLLSGNLHAFWRDSVSYQSGRVTPFSIWGLWGGLGFEQHLVQGAAVALAIAVAFVPAKRGIVEVAALGAAVLILLQLGINYWLYSYIVWFFPLVMLAIFAAHPLTRGPEPARRTPFAEDRAPAALPA
jgi:hypothetical protein